MLSSTFTRIVKWSMVAWLQSPTRKGKSLNSLSMISFSPSPKMTSPFLRKLNRARRLSKGSEPVLLIWSWCLKRLSTYCPGLIKRKLFLLSYCFSYPPVLPVELSSELVSSSFQSTGCEKAKTSMQKSIMRRIEN